MNYKIVTYLLLSMCIASFCPVIHAQSQSKVQVASQVSQTTPEDYAALVGLVQSLLQQGHSVNEVVACVQKTFNLQQNTVELVQTIGTLSQEDLSVPQIIARLNNESREPEMVKEASYKTLCLLGVCVIVGGAALYYAWWLSNNNVVVHGQPNEPCEQLVARYMQNTREDRFESRMAADDAFHQLIERLNVQGHNFSADDGIITISNAFPTWRNFDPFWQKPENRRFL